jgi:glycosyltransferase involved in cell wall biosynthesis
MSARATRGRARAIDRVLLIGPLPPPSGGVATHCTELRCALQAQPLSVSLLDPRRARGGRQRLIAALTAARLGGALVHLHTNGHNRGSWALAALVGLTQAAPRLLTLHSGLAPDFVRAHKKQTRLLCNRFTKVIAVNAAIADALLAVGVAPERLLVCPAFTPAALAFRLAPPGLAQLRRAHRLLLACALAPGPEYGALIMLDAFRLVRARAPEVGLVLLGPGTQHPSLAAAVHARGLGGAVHHLGELPRAQALAVLAAADIFVRPSLADGDALSVREALALGCRVVASDVGARPLGVLTFAAGDAAAGAEQIFRAIANRFPEQVSSVDCLPPLLALYRQLGVRATPA